jgi:hypothetical protein
MWPLFFEIHKPSLHKFISTSSFYFSSSGTFFPYFYKFGKLKVGEEE